MRMKTTQLFLGVFLAIAAAPAVRAHHSFAAEFDLNKPVTLTGAVTRIEWANPHIWVYLDVKDDQATTHWQCEGGAPNTLTRNGWSKDSLKANDQITVDGWLAKDGSKTCNIRSLRMPDGRSVLAGSSGGDIPALPKK
jgi:hypothetical protein